MKLLFQKYAQIFIEFSYFFTIQKKPSADKLKKAKIIAHRGWHDNKSVMENSLLAFEMAEQAGIYGAECDIRWTKDLVPIIHHDPNTERVWGKNIEIAKITFADLKKEIPQIPGLSELMQRWGGRMHLMLELKMEHYPDLPLQKKILEDILKNYRPIDDFHFMSLEIGPYEAFDIFGKECKMLVATTNVDEILELAIEKKLGAVSGQYVFFKDKYLKKARSARLIVGTGLPRTRKTFYREINREIDFVFTDYPWELLSFMR